MSPKENIIVRLEFELTNYNVTVHHIRYNTMGTFLHRVGGEVMYSKDISTKLNATNLVLSMKLNLDLNGPGSHPARGKDVG